MTHYVGLDVSQRTTAICVISEGGERTFRGTCRSDPDAIARIMREHAGEDARTGIETGAMTPWLVHALRERGIDVVCLDARHARAALKMRINKTDQNDAEGLAQIVRMGWYRAVHVKSFETHQARAMLGARSQLVGMKTRLSNQIRGTLKIFGLLPGGVRGIRFDRRVEGLVADRPDVAPLVQPLLVVWRQLGEQIAAFDKAVRSIVRQDPVCRRLMGVPGIGALTVLGFVSTIEDPGRFSNSRAVGAHLGLTPQQHQSGQVDRAGKISRRGDGLARTLMYEAAVVIMTRVKRPSRLKEWALAIAKRSGHGKARVALARKLAVTLHAIWKSGEPFRWMTPIAEAA